MQSWTSLVADAFADIPFGQRTWSSAPSSSSQLLGRDQHVQSGYELQGLLALRLGVFGIFGQVDYFNSQTQYVGAGSPSATGPSTAVA